MRASGVGFAVGDFADEIADHGLFDMSSKRSTTGSMTPERVSGCARMTG